VNNGEIAVKKTVSCNRCGEGNLAWVKSKNEKWYLAETYRDEPFIIAKKYKWHKCSNTMMLAIETAQELSQKAGEDGHETIIEMLIELKKWR
jgi:hypothetical protein